jgi:hypothetical protein
VNIFFFFFVENEEHVETPIFQEILIEDDDPNKDEQTVFLPHHLRCASHTLSLIATTDLTKILKSSSINRLHNGAIGKCTTLWNMSRRPKSSEIIQNVIGCSLSYPCPTRWNSLFDSLNQLLQHKDKLNKLFQQLNVNCNFKEIELVYLNELITLLKPIACALDCLQAQNNCYYGVLLPTLFSLKSRLEILNEKNLKHLASIVTPIINSLKKRFDLFFDLSPEINEAILATCFHPNFKLRWIPDYISDKQKKRIQNLCINVTENFKNEYNNEYETNANSSKDSEDCFFVFTSQPEINKQQTQNELELITYFNDQNKLLNSLNNYPTIKKLFIKYNTSLCSSAPVERLFSFAGFIHAPSRSNLSDNMFEKLVFLKGNQELINN